MPPPLMSTRAHVSFEGDINNDEDLLIALEYAQAAGDTVAVAFVGDGTVFPIDPKDTLDKCRHTHRDRRLAERRQAALKSVKTYDGIERRQGERRKSDQEPRP